MLIGRSAELKRLRAVVEDAVAGRSSTVVVAGEAGIGKSALLHETVHGATGVRILRTVGMQTETDVALSGLLDVLKPVLDRRDVLPESQQVALDRAFALGGRHDDLVASSPLPLRVAVHALIAAAAEERPVVVVVDDAHWLDRESLQALMFAVRRFDTDRVGVLFGVRTVGGTGLPPDLAGLPAVFLDGLDDQSSRELLSIVAPDIDRLVVDAVQSTAQGNPLALIEMPGLLGRDPLETGVLAKPLPIGDVIRGSVESRLAGLPERTRRALLTTAAHDPRHDDLNGALRLMGLSPEDLAPAEDLGLVSLGPETDFAHPLVKAAVYHVASPSARRATHRALADVASGAHDIESRAWHLAAASTGPDPAVADLLVAVGERARLSGAPGAASLAFREAVRFTSDSGRRAELLLEAARCAVTADPAAAAILAEAAADSTADPVVRAHAHRIMALRWNTSGDVRHAVALLVADADRVRAFDPELSVTLLLEAVGPALHSVDYALADMVADRALSEAAAIDAHDLRFAAEVSRGWIDMCRCECDPDRPFGVSWEALLAGAPNGPGVLPFVVAALPWLDTDVRARVVIDRVLSDGRDLRTPSLLPFTLAALADLDFRAGRWHTGVAAAAEGAALAEELGDLNVVARCLVLLAGYESAMGREQECRDMIARALAIAAQSGLLPIQVFASSVLGTLAMTRGDYETAVVEFRRVERELAHHRVSHPGIVAWADDLAESLHRTGRADEANEVLDAHAARVAQARYRPGELSILRARLSMGQTGPRLEAALASVDERLSARVPFEYAKFLLAHGEWLHLQDRRVAARTPLHEAHVTFLRLGAGPWARRAMAGLRAAGGKIAGPSAAPALSTLTPQEIRVARIAASGQRNREIAASLFLSPKTVEGYLSSVYRKLGIRSRAQLVAVLVGGGTV